MDALIKLLDDLTVHAQDKKFEFKRLHSLLYKKEFYYKVIDEIYKDQKVYINNKEIDDSILERLIKSLKDQSFRPVLSEQKIIKEKSIYLDFETFSSEVVSNAIKEILERIYDPIFSLRSYPRTNKNIHKAVLEVKEMLSKTTWIITGDLKKAFYSIDHRLLSDFLRKRIKDERFLSLIQKFLKIGLLEDWKAGLTYSNSLESSKLSEVLSNIYFMAFDLFIEEELKKLKDKNLRSDYLRYKDSFIITIASNKFEATNLKDNLNRFLNKELNISLDEEIKLKHRSKKIRFLEYDFLLKRKESEIQELSSNIVTLKIPNDIFKSFIKDKKLVKSISEKTWKSIHRSNLFYLEDNEILKNFNNELTGLYNYYSLASNVTSVLNKVRYLVEYSCLKTLSLKHKISIQKYKRSHMLKPKIWGVFDKKSNSYIFLRKDFRRKLSSKDIDHRI